MVPISFGIQHGFFWLFLYFNFNFLSSSNTPFTLEKLFTRGSFRMHVSINMVAVVFIYALITILNFYQLTLEKSAAAEQLEREYSQIRLHALKTQVNPHFLFNSLSVLSSLVRIDADTSEKFIIQLSKAYRYILEQKDTELVTLKDELEFLDAYFFLLTIRFDNKVLLEKNVSAGVIGYCLPPLTLQMLVENVVKHNKMSVANPLIIQINTNGDSITVKNNLNPREEEIESTGVGLENIKSRMAYLTDKKINIIASEKYFEVYIPLVKNTKIKV